MRSPRADRDPWRSPAAVPPEPGSDRAYRVIIAGFRALFRLLGLRFDLRGAAHIPAAGPAVLAANHLSYLDFTLVGLAGLQRGRLVRFMAKRSTFANAIAGPAMRAMRHIPVDRESGAAAYRKAVRALAAGEVVGVFPEATISRSFTLKSFKRGAATLAVREEVPLVPVVLWAPQRTFTVDRRYSLRRGKAITIIVGPPLHAAAGESPAELDARLRASMAELLATAWREYPDAPRSAEDAWWLPAELGGGAPTREVAAELERAAWARRAERRARRAGRRG